MKDTIRFACQTCGCPFVDMAEPRVMTGWNGAGGSGVVYFHSSERQCVRALLARVKELEAAVARRRPK